MFGRDRDEQQAFSAVVDAYQGLLLRYAARMLTSRASAEDVVQNAFLKCASHWKGPMRPSDDLVAWLYRVVHNEALDQIRRERRRWSLHRRHAEEQPETVEPGAGRPAEPSDAAAAAAAALAILSERERHLVTLKVYEEKSYKEIAELTGLSIGNVGFILHGAMKKLAGHLGATKGGDHERR